MIFVRRFFKAPRLILTVATIGIAQILVAVSLFMPGWFGDLSADRYAAFVNVDVHRRDRCAFNGNDVAVFVIVPIVLIALAVFMRSSSIGVGLRGSAESANRALLLGVPVKRLHTVVWIISSVLAFIGLFLRAGVVGVSIGRVLGPEVLLPALGAAVIGRMERMPTIVSAAVGLGIVSQSVRYAWNQDAYRDVVIAADHRRRGALRPRAVASTGSATATCRRGRRRGRPGRSRPSCATCSRGRRRAVGTRRCSCWSA